jgi:hypothetical protein
MNLWEIASIVFVAWSAMTLVTAALRGLRKREINLWSEFRTLLSSVAMLAAYLLVMDLGLTTKALAAGAVGGIALGLTLARLAGHEDDYGIIVARGSGLALLPTAASSGAAIWGGIEGQDGLLAAGILGLVVSAGLAFGQTAYWAVAQAGVRRVAPAEAPSAELLAQVDFPESVYACANGHPMTDPSYEFCLACGAPKRLAAASEAGPQPIAALQATRAESPAPAACSCGVLLGAALKFCTVCGRPTSMRAESMTAERRCPRCGAPLAMSDRFCASCGSRAA